MDRRGPYITIPGAPASIQFWGRLLGPRVYGHNRNELGYCRWGDWLDQLIRLQCSADNYGHVHWLAQSSALAAIGGWHELHSDLVRPRTIERKSALCVWPKICSRLYYDHEYSLQDSLTQRSLQVTQSSPYLLKQTLGEGDPRAKKNHSETKKPS